MLNSSDDISIVMPPGLVAVRLFTVASANLISDFNLPGSFHLCHESVFQCIHLMFETLCLLPFFFISCIWLMVTIFYHVNPCIHLCILLLSVILILSIRVLFSFCLSAFLLISFLNVRYLSLVLFIVSYSLFLEFYVSIFFLFPWVSLNVLHFEFPVSFKLWHIKVMDNLILCRSNFLQ